jgi:hypothetical protein
LASRNGPSCSLITPNIPYDPAFCCNMPGTVLAAGDIKLVPENIHIILI